MRFLQQDALRLPIIVADGSASDAAAQNEEFCKSAGTNVEYFHLPPAESESGGANYMQRSVVDPAAGIFPGPDIDLIGRDERYDGCHLNAAGLQRAAELWYAALRPVR